MAHDMALVENSQASNYHRQNVTELNMFVTVPLPVLQ